MSGLMFIVPKLFSRCGIFTRDKKILGFCDVFAKKDFSTFPDKISSGDMCKEVSTTSKKEIVTFLNQMNMVNSEKHACIMTTCLRNNKSKVKFEKLEKLYINSTTGYFACHSCHKTGSWSKFKENTLKLNEYFNSNRSRLPSCFDKDENVKSSIDNPSHVEACKIFEEAIPVDSCDEGKLSLLLEDLNIEGIKMSTFEKYQVRIKKDYSGILFPLIGLKNRVIGVKIFNVHKQIEEDEEGPLVQKKFHVTFHSGENLYGLFGFNLMQPITPEIVLTSSEVDALIVFQETGKVALCLPRGDPVLPQEVLPLLEPISQITLWMSSENIRWDDTKHFATKLGDGRCRLIRPDVTRPAAFEAFKSRLDMQKILNSSVSMRHNCITTLQESMDELRNKIYDSDEAAGVKWQRFPRLNQLLKGHRRGELTVLTGPTGSGKTTFISEYSLDLAMQGVKTLWGSFEINNIRLMEIMLTQFAQMDLASNSDKFDYYFELLSQLPLYFMTFRGEESIQKVVEVMTHAAYVHDIGHVVVDNLQFMMGISDSNTFDRYLKQDLVFSAFRKFATRSNCHVTLIIHPRKEATELLSVSSVFGSAKATQEADNVLLLQSTGMVGRGKKFIQVAKNRYAGDLGIMPLKFNKECLSFGLKSRDKTSETSEPTDSQNTIEDKFELEPNLNYDSV